MSEINNLSLKIAKVPLIKTNKKMIIKYVSLICAHFNW